MKKRASLTLLVLLLFQISLAQKKDVKIIIKEASEAFNVQDYETTIQKIEEIKIEFKKNSPPPFVLSMEILAKSEIIKTNPLDNYALITSTRNLTNKYLKNPNSKKDLNYSAVVQENNILNTYPKDLATFNAQKEAKLREEALQKEREEKEAAEAKLRKEKEEVEAKARMEREAIQRQERLEQERVRNEAAAKERELNRAAEEKAEEKRAKEAEAYSKKVDRENKSHLNSFSSLGIQSGEIAKYGFIYERGGRKTIGFRFSARTSLTSEEDILNGKATENKTEIELGPNFKIFKRIYLNIGVGYGYYNRIMNNDYSGEVNLEKTGYSVATAGLMIRVSRVININGGAALMDIDKDLYKPEITFGISFNLKGKYKY
ncbi:cell envelope integrity protein TolA [Flavobacterium sp.]|uniref:cell envelope integrity protein TolA n=1 Tax=Flavobacterium sp. TaxID=239 RepID=UPI0024889C34|nr:cell envelope integrity protein TolA [Flavobacterium sp.]MDI1317427.1 cell envelope integrity protein TolA [Flavobacterium sp.]